MIVTAAAVPSTAAPAPVIARARPPGSRRSAAAITWTTNRPTMITKATEVSTATFRPT